jgi:hypothetical protein
LLRNASLDALRQRLVVSFPPPTPTRAGGDSSVQIFHTGFTSLARLLSDGIISPAGKPITIPE